MGRSASWPKTDARVLRSTIVIVIVDVVVARSGETNLARIAPPVARSFVRSFVRSVVDDASSIENDEGRTRRIVLNTNRGGTRRRSRSSPGGGGFRAIARSIDRENERWDD